MCCRFCFKRWRDSNTHFIEKGFCRVLNRLCEYQSLIEAQMSSLGYSVTFIAYLYNPFTRPSGELDLYVNLGVPGVPDVCGRPAPSFTCSYLYNSFLRPSREIILHANLVSLVSQTVWHTSVTPFVCSLEGLHILSYVCDASSITSQLIWKPLPMISTRNYLCEAKILSQQLICNL